jgi:hypothetical protein
MRGEAVAKEERALHGLKPELNGAHGDVIVHVRYPILADGMQFTENTSEAYIDGEAFGLGSRAQVLWLCASIQEGLEDLLPRVASWCY